MSASVILYALLALAAALCAVGSRAAWFVLRGGFVRELLERDGTIGAVLAVLAAAAHVSLIAAGFLLVDWRGWAAVLAASAVLGAVVVTRRSWPFWHAFKPLVDGLALVCVGLVWAVRAGWVQV